MIDEEDIRAGTIFEDYPNPKRPLDFVIYDADKILAVGLVRYDGDRGGAQEDDRIGGICPSKRYQTYQEDKPLVEEILADWLA